MRFFRIKYLTASLAKIKIIYRIKNNVYKTHLPGISSTGTLSKYSENRSAFKVALINITVKSFLTLTRSLRISKRKSLSSDLSCTSSTNIWVTDLS